MGKLGVFWQKKCFGWCILVLSGVHSGKVSRGVFGTFWGVFWYLPRFFFGPKLGFFWYKEGVLFGMHRISSSTCLTMCITGWRCASQLLYLPSLMLKKEKKMPDFLFPFTTRVAADK